MFCRPSFGVGLRNHPPLLSGTTLNSRNLAASRKNARVRTRCDRPGMKFRLPRSIFFLGFARAQHSVGLVASPGIPWPEDWGLALGPGLYCGSRDEILRRRLTSANGYWRMKQSPRPPPRGVDSDFREAERAQKRSSVCPSFRCAGRPAVHNEISRSAGKVHTCASTRRFWASQRKRDWMFTASCSRS